MQCSAPFVRTLRGLAGRAAARCPAPSRRDAYVSRIRRLISTSPDCLEQDRMEASVLSGPCAHARPCTPSLWLAKNCHYLKHVIALLLPHISSPAGITGSVPKVVRDRCGTGSCVRCHGPVHGPVNEQDRTVSPVLGLRGPGPRDAVRTAIISLLFIHQKLL
jgi:hypothetical protein